jgi:glucose-1-phosphate adenylyltransferase
VLDHYLWEDRQRKGSSHDFGKDILPRMIANNARVFAYPFSGYWVDVGTVSSYWKAHMDLLQSEPPVDLHDRDWIVHTRTEERPPVRISRSASISDSMVTDGCEIRPEALVERSVLSAGVMVGQGAVVRESVILTDAVIGPGAVVERAIIDKRVQIGRGARVGSAGPGEELQITMVGKNSLIPEGFIVEGGAVIATDVVASDYDKPIVHSDQTLETKRLAYEV